MTTMTEKIEQRVQAEAPVRMTRRNVAGLLGLLGITALGAEALDTPENAAVEPGDHAAVALQECGFFLRLEILDDEQDPEAMERGEPPRSHTVRVMGEVSRTFDQWAMSGWAGPGQWFSVPIRHDGEVAHFIAAAQEAEHLDPSLEAQIRRAEAVLDGKR